jgi:hypothetical protein
MRRVKNWQSGSMALRWTAAAFDATSKGFRRIMGHEHLWMLKAALEEPAKDRSLVRRRLPDNLEVQAGAATSFHWPWDIIHVVSEIQVLIA